MNKLYLLNSPIMSNWGEFVFLPIDLQSAKDLISKYGFESAIGHQGTADLLSEILGITIPVNRVKITMEVGDIAIVFLLKDRLPEGRILSYDELKKMRCELGYIEMTSSREELEELAQDDMYDFLEDEEEDEDYEEEDEEEDEEEGL